MDDAVLPAPSDVVLRALLERRATADPDAPLVDFADGTRWSCADALAAAYGAAHRLRAAGVSRGDPVAVALPNGPEFLRAWWGLACLGAVAVPVNLAYRGSLLRHLLDTAGCGLVVADPERADRVREVDGPRVLDPSTLAGSDAAAPALDRPIAADDVHMLCMTSGTTGPSKLSRTSYWHTALGLAHLTRRGLGPDDVYLVDLPLFHLGGVYSVMTTLAVGARIALRPAPALNRYWETARETGATAAVLVSSMISYLLAQPPRAADTEHGLRLVTSIPQPPDGAAFRARFRITEIATGYGSTEVPACLVQHPDRPAAPGSCGQVRDGFAVRLVDSRGVEVPVGATGEAVVRPAHPAMISLGYHADAGATAEAWCDGWFRTGDLLSRDAEGNHFFVDRRTDSLRRRGENISSFEVEAEVSAFPGVAEVACVAHREPGWIDDEVKVWLVPAAGAEVDPAALLRFCAARMPHFMVPRYLEICPQLPKTPTAKVAKYQLRARGNGEHTWDREAAGLSVGPDGVVAGRTR